MRKILLGLGVLVVVYACSDTVGGVLEDAGTMLQDGGASAQNPEAHNVVCDQTRVTTSRSYDSEGALSHTVTSRQEYAVLEVPDFRSAGVEHCLAPPNDTWVTCPSGNDRTEVECTGLLPEQGCSYGVFNYHRGNTIVIHCGNSTRIDYVNPDNTDSFSETTYTSITAWY